MAEQKTRNEPGGLRSYRHFPYPHPGMPMAHTHNDIEINYVAEGDITYRFGNSQARFGAGSVYVFWATVPHYIVQHTPGTLFFALHLPVASFLQWHLPSNITQRTLAGELLAFPRTHDQDFCHLLFEQIHRHIQSNTSAEKMIALLEIEAWVRTLALTSAPAVPDPVGNNPGNDSVDRMISFMIRSFKEPLSVAQIAQQVHLHPNYAMQLFRKCTGRTILAYLTQYRVAHAQQLLLTTDLSISDIALAAGFTSLSRFYCRFDDIEMAKAKWQLSNQPSRYRLIWASQAEPRCVFAEW